jgi:hypothetical protein
MKTIYLEELGTPVATKDHYQLFAEDGLFRIYLVGPEWDFNEEGETIYTGRTEAVPAGYISDAENFEFGILAIQEEARYLSA